MQTDDRHSKSRFKNVIELPTVKYMIKYICYSTSHILSMVYIFGCPIIESFSPASCVIK